MDSNLISLIKDRPIVIPKLLFNNYRLLGINDSEFVVIMLILYMGGKVIYNPEEFSREINMSKHEVMKIINDLMEKNILSLVVEKSNRKTCEYLSLDLLYEKLFNIVIDTDKKEETVVDNSIFSVFENEIGRPLSPMEYEQIKEWINSGNSIEIITLALKEAVINGVSSFRYIDTILNGWRKKGYKNREDVLKDKENYRSKKSKIEIFDTDWLND